MKGLAAWVIEGLPFDPRSRRAIDETLEDWSQEAAESRSRPERVLTAVHGLLAVGRVISVGVVREAFDLGWCRGLAKRCGAVASVAILISLAVALPTLDTLGPRMLDLAIRLAPIFLIGMAPPAVFLVLAWRPASRGFPTIGAAALLTILTAAAAGWLLPWSSEAAGQLLYQHTIDELSSSIGTSGVLSGASTLSSRPPRELVFLYFWLYATGLAGLVGATTVFAGRAARHFPLTSRWWLIVAPLAFGALSLTCRLAILLALGLLDGLGVQVLFGSGAQRLLDGVALWLAAALVMTAALAYRRTDPAHTT